MRGGPTLHLGCSVLMLGLMLVWRLAVAPAWPGEPVDVAPPATRRRLSYGLSEKEGRQKRRPRRSDRQSATSHGLSTTGVLSPIQPVRRRPILAPISKYGGRRNISRIRRGWRTAVAAPPSGRHYATAEPPGTIIIDTSHTYLYLTLGSGPGDPLRYSRWSPRLHLVGRRAHQSDEGMAGLVPTEADDRATAYLPRFMAGGETNPLGARAMYLGNTEYRIHGTNDSSTSRRLRVLWLHSSDQRGCGGSLQPR